tara:strand:+ start:24 stop:740 length:717 start_codon:yes stop_codon:yes gene_type:complete
MRRIKYLIDSGSSTTLLKKYIVYFFYLHLKKKERKKFINNYRNFYNKKKFTCDFFSQNTFDWINILNEFKKKELNYLEIGSFEGNSALFILNNFNVKSVLCVDPWKQLSKKEGSNEGYEDIPIKIIENNFDENLKPHQGKFKKYKMRSEVFFKKNAFDFDVIYIDGSHLAEDVLKDCRSSWSCLKRDGILILDDFFWNNYDKIEHNPAYAINTFLKEIENNYKIICLSKFQLFIRKIK